MIVGRSLGAIALSAFALLPGPAAAGVEPVIATSGEVADPIGDCGGFAPYVQSCSFAGILPAASTVHLRAQPEFTGRIGMRMTTSTGSYTASCDFLGAEEPVCRSSTSGTLQIGQSFNAYATASLAPADGVEAPVAFGRWRVSLTTQ